jgi:hypothetical protein
VRTRLNAAEKAAGYEVNRLVSGYAYARNGNTHNPTPRYTWQVMFKGRQIGMVYRASHAVDLVEEHMKDESKRPTTLTRQPASMRLRT